jgi:hypothetical protein
MAPCMGSSLRGGPHGLQRHAVLTIINFVFSFRASTRVNVLGIVQSRTGSTIFTRTDQSDSSRTRPANFSRTDPTNLESKFNGYINYCAGHDRYVACSG